MPRALTCECGTCRTCKRREYRRLERSRTLPVHRKVRRVPDPEPKPRNLDKLDLKALEVWAMHSDVRAPRYYRTALAEMIQEA